MKNNFLKVIVILVVNLLILTGCQTKEKNNSIIEKNEMLSYTIDGKKTDKKITKEDGYIVNKIICNNGTDLMWDNDNWEVEFTTIKSNDSCVVDYTEDTNRQGYRVTITSNMPESLDSLSKATTENGTVKIYSKSKIESVTECNGIIEDNKLIISNVSSNQTCNIIVELKTLADTIKLKYQPQPGRTDFSNIDNGTPRLYTDMDDQGTTYYFSGNGTNMNNWVFFVGKMWRIIRINGNGSIRLLYSGDGIDASDLGSSAFNKTYNDPIYVGWKYGATGSLSNNRTNENLSTIYSKVEMWYNSLNSENKKYIDNNAIYCNDRELASGNLYSTISTFYYEASNRLSPYSSDTPTFKCKNENDRFNIFGLMTADEIVYAGGKHGTSSYYAYYYLNKNKGSITGSNAWWTMSPNIWVGENTQQVTSFAVRGSDYPGALFAETVHANRVIRPVISLKSEVQVTGGDGSGSNPYTVLMP
ncbi:MAG: hypothetical protein HFE04_00680 [Bacilli bacterium]|nr:hypothetical protein [Bacilli bacterium]